MTTCLYVPRDAAFLAKRWLAARPDGETVCLVAAAGADALTAELRDAFPCIQEVIEEDDPATIERLQALLAGMDVPQVTLPIAVDVLPLRYQFPARIPQVMPLYPLFQRLWRLGFRAMELYTLSGTRVLHVPHLLEEFQGRHQDRRCFVVGNGPSLNDLDMGRLKDEITLGANRCYLGFQDWGFPFTYWGISDRLQIESYGSEYEAHLPGDMVKFLPFEYLPFLDFEHGCPVFLDWPRAATREFSNEAGRLSVGYSVVYLLLQVAAVMGCNPIILIGVDHRYHLQKKQRLTRRIRLCGRWLARHYDQTAWYKAGHAAYLEFFKARHSAGPAAPRRVWKADDAQGPTHFDARYTDERKRFLMPRPLDAEQDFACAARWAEENGLQILNATPNSALDSFPKVSFDSLF